MVFSCENDPCDCNGISDRESDDFAEHCLVSHGNRYDQCQIIISKKIATILVLSAINIWVMRVCFVKIFMDRGNVKVDTRIYDTDC